MAQFLRHTGHVLSLIKSRQSCANETTRDSGGRRVNLLLDPPIDTVAAERVAAVGDDRFAENAAADHTRQLFLQVGVDFDEPRRVVSHVDSGDKLDKRGAR